MSLQDLSVFLLSGHFRWSVDIVTWHPAPSANIPQPPSGNCLCIANEPVNPKPNHRKLHFRSWNDVGMSCRITVFKMYFFYFFIISLKISLTFEQYNFKNWYFWFVYCVTFINQSMMSNWYFLGLRWQCLEILNRYKQTDR